MSRLFVLLLMVASLAAGCTQPTEGTLPPIAMPDNDGGDLPTTTPMNESLPMPPHPSGPAYTPPNRTAPADDAPPVVEVQLQAIPEFHQVRMNYTFVGADPENTTVAWTADLDGDGRFDVSGRGLPATVSHVFLIHGPYEVRLLANDGFHEVEVVVPFQVEAELVRPYIDAAGTITADPATYAQCLTLFAPPNQTFPVPSEAWNAPFVLKSNYTGAWSRIAVTWIAESGATGAGGASSTAEARVEGTIPRMVGSPLSPVVAGRVGACAEQADWHFIAFSQGWCRPARENCQDNAGNPYA